MAGGDWLHADAFVIREQSLTSPDTAGGLARGSYLFQCVEHIVFRKGGESALY